MVLNDHYDLGVVGKDYNINYILFYFFYLLLIIDGFIFLASFPFEDIYSDKMYFQFKIVK